jgi:hypothetical protein
LHNCFSPVSITVLVFPSFSGGHVFKEELLPPADDPADFPELLDVTEEQLLASVDELDFAEEELFVDEDETLLLDLSSLLLQDEGLEPSWLSPLRVAPLSEDSFSGSTKLLLSSSPQAVKDMVMANSTRVRNLQNLIRSSSMQKDVIAYTQQSRP